MSLGKLVQWCQNRPLAKFVLSVVLFSSIGLVFSEMLLKYWQVSDDERNILYEYDDELGWIPQKGIEKSFVGSQKYWVKHNSSGFREKEFEDLLKNEKRIMILGDSFAYGYDSEVEDRFSDKLALSMPDYSILNLGVSGYSTDQEYILLKRYYNELKPNIVYLIYNHDDAYGNCTNYMFNGYYKPYYTNVNKVIQLKGTPVPMGLKYLKFEYPIIFNSRTAVYLTTKALNSYNPKVDVSMDITFLLLSSINQYLSSKDNCILKVGIIGEGSTDGLVEFLDQNKMDWKILEEGFGQDCYIESGHWSKLGNQLIADRIQSHISR